MPLTPQDSLTAEVPAAVPEAARTDPGAGDTVAARTVTAPADTSRTSDTRPGEVSTVRAQRAVSTEGTVTVAADTVAADSATFRIPMLLEPAEPQELVAETAPPPPPAWLDGLLPVARTGRTADDGGFVAIIVLIMLGMSLSFGNIRHIWGTLIKRLWTTRVRQNFDHITSPERRTIGLLLSVCVFFIALLCNAAMTLVAPSDFSFSLGVTLRIGAVTATYFLLQYVVYWLIGYTFTSTDGRNLWVEGFTASMSLLGIMMILPGLTVLFYPSLTAAALWTAAGLYVLARIMFICKGFRIFYTNLASLVYFILYLCSLEIIPLSIFYLSIRHVCSNLSVTT